MAKILDPHDGQLLTDGLQGCDTCDEAIQTAQRMADARGRDVHLVDDDGEWLVHPAIDGARKLADPIEPETETDPDAEVTTITTLENGDVRVERKYFDGEAMQTMSRDFRAVGAYVHQVYPNGATAQICEGLQLRGPALMAGDDLAATIRATLK